MSEERLLQVGDELSAIANIQDLVAEGRVPIKLQPAEVGSPIEFAGKKHFPSTKVIFYNIPPVGFTLGKNGCTGKADSISLSVEYFDGNGESLSRSFL